MNTLRIAPLRRFALISTAAVAFAAASGLAFGMWVDKGAAIFLALSESGLAWCL